MQTGMLCDPIGLARCTAVRVREDCPSAVGRSPPGSCCYQGIDAQATVYEPLAMACARTPRSPPQAAGADSVAAGAAGVRVQARHAPRHNPLARIQPGCGAAGAAVRGLRPWHRAPVPAGGARAVRRLRRPRSRVSSVWACSPAGGATPVRLPTGPACPVHAQSAVNAVVKVFGFADSVLLSLLGAPFLAATSAVVCAGACLAAAGGGRPCLPAALPAVLPAAPPDPTDMVQVAGCGSSLRDPGVGHAVRAGGRRLDGPAALLRHAAAALPGTAPPRKAGLLRACAHFGHL